jgi:hypothetical protein
MRASGVCVLIGMVALAAKAPAAALALGALLLWIWRKG